ncbi:PR domain zinc finger protein 5-like isoform X1 [Amyelois transitella]|uniref:PR domain zinc finger protein 5-like isoform X1 n=1 Tax=Amyelois transitella TaxID=680683 RepID=UPI00298F8AA7|nr:PR domain zinc finger protein 5-like isoform X1 [Amyelois transitella]
MNSQPAIVKLKGPILDPGLCRCCRSIKKCRFLTAEYEWKGHKEIYSDMFMDCFGLLLSNMDGDSKDSCICATCVSRLREAFTFRQQVLASEEVFLSARLENKELDIDLEVDHKLEVVVKAEPVCEMETNSHVDDRDDIADDHGEDSDYKMELDIPKQESKKEIKLKRKKVPVKKEVLTKMKKLRQKLDQMLDKPAPSTGKKEKTPKSKKKSTIDHDYMAYANTVTIVKNSFVCPFLNRISNYYCFYCKDQFTNPSELREHTMTHDPREIFEPSMENKKIPKIDITRVDCRLCDTKIDDLPAFKTHVTSVHGKSLYPIDNEFLKFKLTLNNLSCTECGNVFPFFDSLKKHMIDHFGTFVCDVCGACFLEQASLRTHIKSHSKVDGNFPCEICGKNLKSKYSRYLHVATVHEKKPTVNCYKCEASFLSHALRNRHLIEVHGDKRTFPCKLCDKVYNRRKTLMEHNRRNHLKVYKHQCDLCDQKFYLPSRLKEHMATHTGERNFRCEFCEKSYPRLQSLQEHVRSHNSDRKYKCDFCNSAFAQNGSLKSHMKSHQQSYDIDTGFS